MSYTDNRMNDNSAKERSLNPTTHSDLTTIPKAEATEELDERILGALHAASDKKALDLVVLDLREIATFTDYFVIVSGNNDRQVQAISDEVFERLKKSGTAAARVEGYKSAEWILLDYGDFIVHVFADKARKFYDLERLWRESKRVGLPGEFGGESNSSLRDDL
jgi:ribosome-associated protein